MVIEELMPWRLLKTIGGPTETVDVLKENHDEDDNLHAEGLPLLATGVFRDKSKALQLSWKQLPVKLPSQCTKQVVSNLGLNQITISMNNLAMQELPVFSLQQRLIRDGHLHSWFTGSEPGKWRLRDHFVLLMYCVFLDSERGSAGCKVDVKADGQRVEKSPYHDSQHMRAVPFCDHDKETHATDPDLEAAIILTTNSEGNG
ncbi:hypothetical protein VNO77_08655 [Canavalia gladiata]|uniref:Uncharacterized protein n=1 Tax=Canavalia gladiata TaxID=3824 RepID=A0AAN9QW94_CANGL